MTKEKKYVSFSAGLLRQDQSGRKEESRERYPIGISHPLPSFSKGLGIKAHQTLGRSIAAEYIS